MTMCSNKKIDLNLLLDNIRLEIGQYDQAGLDIAKVKLKAAEVDLLDSIKEHLYVDGRTFTFEKTTRTLTINSSKCERMD